MANNIDNYGYGPAPSGWIYPQFYPNNYVNYHANAYIYGQNFSPVPYCSETSVHSNWQSPDLEAVSEKPSGISDTTFGALLKDICNRDNSAVPNFVKLCIKSIENRGLKQDGLYRVSGNLAEIQKLRLSVDNINANSRFNLDDECWDIHTLTGALKLFFRELKEPLIPFNKFDKLMEIVKAESATKREENLRKYKEIIHSFPKCHFETLKMLLQHLLRVIKLSEHNRMLTQNVAIVFGPTLMWPERELHNLAISITYQSQIVQFLLQNYASIF
ncbi:rho GTPase-activating protein 15 isoform X2 [Octopus bimaculoides]|uniref:rho GTPase-activating protein 15 isoform X2 n=1 Tax=Octopus bimaculoides TaxID=37653 RepID=UPI0022E06118|nr:rho GTPase-activating protein 15 isoform X2 [Octopus bimaculoides]